MYNDLGLNNFLYKDSQSNDISTISAEEGKFLGEVASENIVSGEISGNLEIVDGFIRSKGFVSGSVGWNIDSNGSIEAADLTLTGGTIKYGKTSFSDSANAGYWIGSSGLYFGSANDASYIKYNISAATFSVKADIIIKSGSGIANLTDAGALATIDQVDTAEIVDLAVQTAKLDDLSVATGKIAGLAVTTAKIDNLAVDNAKIANLAVTNAKINDLAVDKLTAGTITSKALELAVSAGTGDSYLAGKVALATYDWLNWEVDGGFMLGLDDSDNDYAKLFIGDSGGSYLKYDGIDLKIVAGAGSSIDFSYVAGATKPDDNATVGAVAGTNLTDEATVVLNSTDIKNILTLPALININAGDAVAIDTNGKIFPTDDTVSTQRANFIGFALENIALGSTGKIKLIGIAENLSGLTTADTYYLESAVYNLDQQQTLSDS